MANYILPPTISYSRVNTFRKCMRKYYHEYVLEIQRETNEHFIFGSKVHEMMEQYMVGDDVDTTLEKEYENIINEKLNIPNMQEYWDYLEPEIDEVFKDTLFKYDLIATELELHVEEIHFHGIIDLIMYDPETQTVLVLDYKTGKGDKSLNDLNRDGQLTLYALALAYNDEILEDYVVKNFKIGYINLPKYVPTEPDILKSGKPTKSKSKLKSVSKSKYIDAIQNCGDNIKNYKEILDWFDDKEKPVSIVDTFVDYEWARELGGTHADMWKTIAYHYDEMLFPKSYDGYHKKYCTCHEVDEALKNEKGVI